MLLPDDFNDNSRDAARWNLGVLSAPAADALVTVLEQNQRLEIQPRANTAGNHYNGYVSALTWNLTNTFTSVEVVSAPTNGSDTIFAIGNDNNNYYRFVVSGGLLFFQERFGGVLTQTSIAFDAEQPPLLAFPPRPGHGSGDLRNQSQWSDELERPAHGAAAHRADGGARGVERRVSAEPRRAGQVYLRQPRAEQRVSDANSNTYAATHGYFYPDTGPNTPWPNNQRQRLWGQGEWAGRRHGGDPLCFGGVNNANQTTLFSHWYVPDRRRRVSLGSTPPPNCKCCYRTGKNGTPSSKSPS